MTIHVKSGLWLVLLLLGALACGRSRPAARPAGGPAPATGSSPARPAPLDDMLRDDLAEEGAFPWSAGRRLVWGDFRGTAPAGGSESAVTAYGLFFAWKCLGERFEFRVVAAFRPRRSWVKAAVLRDSVESRRTLEHEQGHFDLSEVHARKMRAAFARLDAPCRRTDAQLTTIAQAFVQDEKAEQRRYDGETNHGLVVERQAAWTRSVARRLDALGPFAR